MTAQRLPAALTRRSLLRSVTAAGGLAAFGGLAAACAPSASSGGGDSGADTEAKKMTFSSWSMNEAASKEQLGKLVGAWSTANGVTVDTPSYPFNDYVKQMLLRVRGNQVTGAAQLDISSLATFAQVGKLVDMTAAAGKGGYTAKAIELSQVDGKQMALPWTTAAIGLVANGQLLTRAGITTAPTTIADFEAALEKLRAPGIIPYAAMTKIAQLKDIVPWMWQFGSPVFDGKEFTLGDASSVAAVTWYKSLLDRKLIAADIDRFDARALFGQGKIAVYEDAVAGKKFIAASAKDKTIVDAMTPWPRPVKNAGDKPVCLAWGQVIVVFQGAASATASRFAEHMTADVATAVQYFKDASYPPTTDKGLAAPEVGGDRWTKEFTERITSAGRPNPLWKIPEYPQIEQKLSEYVQSVLVGRRTPQDALNTARKELQALIK